MKILCISDGPLTPVVYELMEQLTPRAVFRLNGERLWLELWGNAMPLLQQADLIYLEPEPSDDYHQSLVVLLGIIPPHRFVTSDLGVKKPAVNIHGRDVLNLAFPFIGRGLGDPGAFREALALWKHKVKREAKLAHGSGWYTDSKGCLWRVQPMPNNGYGLETKEYSWVGEDWENSSNEGGLKFISKIAPWSLTWNHDEPWYLVPLK